MVRFDGSQTEEWDINILPLLKEDGRNSPRYRVSVLTEKLLLLLDVLKITH